MKCPGLVNINVICFALCNVLKKIKNRLLKLFFTLCDLFAFGSGVIKVRFMQHPSCNSIIPFAIAVGNLIFKKKNE